MLHRFVETLEPRQLFAATPANATAFVAMPAAALTPEETATYRSRVVLKRLPFAATNPNLFLPSIYGGAAYAPAAAPKREANTPRVRASLAAILALKFGTNDPHVAAGLNVYDDALLTQRVPDARLRAGVAMLVGTFGEPLIGTYRKNTFAGLTFTTLDSGVIASTETGADGKRRVFINSIYQNEDFRLFTPTLVHEALHADGTRYTTARVSNKEELIANAVETIAYGQLINTFPTLASNATDLVQRYNTKLLARLNTRDRTGALRLLTARAQVYPGSSNTLAAFASGFMASDYTDAPGNVPLNLVLTSLTGRSYTTAAFDDSAVSLLDSLQGFGPRAAVKLGVTLQLNLDSAGA